MQISDSSTEEISPVKRKPSPVKPKSKPQSICILLGLVLLFYHSRINNNCFSGKLENLKYTSRFFKETSANDVFGDEPIKRNDKKLKELQEKLKAVSFNQVLIIFELICVHDLTFDKFSV